MVIKGRAEYRRFLKGKNLTFREAILAQCYVCNGGNEGGVDCLGYSCPLYPHMPYSSMKKKSKILPSKRRKNAGLKGLKSMKNSCK